MGLSRGLAQGPGQASSVGCDAQTSAPSTDPCSSPTPHGIPRGDHWCVHLLQVGSSCCSPHPEPSLGLSPASDTESCLPGRGPGPLRRCSRPVAARGCARSTERHQNGPFCSARGVWPPGGGWSQPGERSPSELSEAQRPLRAELLPPLPVSARPAGSGEHQTAGWLRSRPD